MKALHRAAALLLLSAGCGLREAPAPVPDVVRSPDGGSPPAPQVVPPEAPESVPSLDAPGHERLGPPRPGDWRSRFPGDTPMPFDEYVSSEPVRADEDRRVLAFLPVGEFGPAERAALDAAAEFSGIWFDLPVRVLAPQPLTGDETQFRTRGGFGDSPDGRQYRTGWFLNALLPDRVPDDAVVLLGVTVADLYPGRGWNFVFGQADLRRRVGVYSLARYFPEFSGEERNETTLRRALLRTLKVVVHEAGHTFGLEHCVVWACTMNGSNSLDETDGQPLRLCPECLRKLAWNRGLDPAARAAKVAKFLEDRGFPEEAAWHRAHGAAVR